MTLLLPRDQFDALGHDVVQVTSEEEEEDAPAGGEEEVLRADRSSLFPGLSGSSRSSWPTTSSRNHVTVGRVLGAVYRHYQREVSPEEQIAAMRADVRLRKRLQVGAVRLS